MKARKYAIIDIETTGGMTHRDKITEIGIVIHDGQQTITEYESLVNPGRSIPANITRITGITDEMVEDAPYFHEIAKTIIELTEDAVFVAHNVGFDYGFIKHAFAELGFTYRKKQLCTVRLSRKAFPGLKSYSLGNLIKHFDIQVDARHRALDDAKATVIVLEKILAKQENDSHIEQLVNHGIQTARLPQNISLEYLHQLPESCGVYYFHNGYGTPVYIGKSTNIKKRIFQHFGKTTKKAANLQQLAHSITYQETGSELASLLLESEEIKKHQPEINKAQRTRNYPYFIHQYKDTANYLCFGILKTNKKNSLNKDILGYFKSKQACKQVLDRLKEKLQLCRMKAGLEEGQMFGCFDYKIEQCLGACMSKETAEDYNSRASMAKHEINQVFDEDFILIDAGRTADEKCIFLVQDKHFRGYGYISVDDLQYGFEELMESIEYNTPNPDKNKIVALYLRQNKYEKKLVL